MKRIEPSGSPKNSPITQKTEPEKRATSPLHSLEQQKSGALSPLAGRVTLSGQRLQEIQKQSLEIVSEFKRLNQLKSQENALEDVLEELKDGASDFENKEKEYKNVRLQKTQSEKNLLALEKKLLDYCNNSINQKESIDSLPVLFSRA